MTRSVPSDDWCSVERAIPITTSGSVNRRRKAKARFQRSPSNTTGANSSASTVR